MTIERIADEAHHANQFLNHVLFRLDTKLDSSEVKLTPYDMATLILSFEAGAKRQLNDDFLENAIRERIQLESKKEGFNYQKGTIKKLTSLLTPVSASWQFHNELIYHSNLPHDLDCTVETHPLETDFINNLLGPFIYHDGAVQQPSQKELSLMFWGFQAGIHQAIILPALRSTVQDYEKDLNKIIIQDDDQQKSKYLSVIHHLPDMIDSVKNHNWYGPDNPQNRYR